MYFTNYDLCIELSLLKICTFNCPYCFDKSYNDKVKNWIKYNFLRKKILRDLDINIICSNIEKLNHKCLVRLEGGEPFLFPKFVDLCKLLIRKNHIDVTTNLSHKNVYSFADEINPNKVEFIYVSLHMTELEKYNLVDDFIAKIKYLKKKRFKTRVRYVMYPPLLKRFEEDYKFFKSQGIVIESKKFRGKYLSKEYPLSYSKKERQTILKYLKKDRKKLFKSNFNFKGRQCLAGKSSIIVNHEGLIFRCWGDQRPIGNFFKGGIKLYDDAKTCEVNNCLCPAEGIRLVVK